MSLFIVDAAGDLEQRTYGLIGNFGIALLSTVAGILGRILLQSAGPLAAGNPPPALAADGLDRKELEELRRQIRYATDAFRHFTRVTTEQTSENRLQVMRQVEDSIKQMNQQAKAAITETQATWNKAVLKIHSDNNELLGQVDQDLRSAFGRASTAWLELAQSAEVASSDTRKRLELLTKETSSMLQTMSAINQAFGPLSEGLVKVTGKVEQLGETAATAVKGLEARGNELVKAHEALTKGAQQFQKDSLQAYEDAVLQFMKTAHEGLSKEMNAWTTAVQDFAAAAAAQQQISERNSENTQRLLGALSASSSKRRPMAKRPIKRRVPSRHK